MIERDIGVVREEESRLLVKRDARDILQLRFVARSKASLILPILIITNCRPESWHLCQTIRCAKYALISYNVIDLNISYRAQILVQIQQTAVQSQRALNVSVQQASAKERERRILQLTIDEITQMKGDVNLYKGVGKMYV